MDASPIAREFARRVVRSMRGVKAIILYGSVARHEEREDSDIDILVISSGNRSDAQYDLAGLAIDLLLETRRYVSAKAVGVVDFERMRNDGNPFVRNVMREGVILHGSIA
jgi:predicted nucleotidyltransferase